MSLDSSGLTRQLATTSALDRENHSRVAFEELVVFLLVVIDPQRMEVRCYASRSKERSLSQSCMSSLALGRSP